MIKEAIETAQEKYLQEKIHRSRWKSIRASGIADSCNRRLFYYLTCGELAEEVDTDLIALFEEGKEQEPSVRRYLSELGFEIQKSTFSDYWEKYNISGQIDGTLGDYLVEIKTVSEFAWSALNSIEDFKEGYYRKWFGQMMIYLLLFNYEKGIFILKRKQAKQLKIIEVSLDYEYAEELLKKAELINKALVQNEPPEFLKGNVVECKRCPFFGKVCNPPMDFGQTQIIEDAEFEVKLVEREELSVACARYEKLDKEIKERLRDIPAAICGDFEIIGKAGIMKRAAREAKEIPTWKTTIRRIGEKQEI